MSKISMSLGGVVTDNATGLPLEGALVTCSDKSGLSLIDGSYFLDGMTYDPPANPVAVTCALAGYVTGNGNAELREVVPADDLNFALVADATATTGTITDADGAIEGATVTVRSQGVVYSTVTDASGDYSFDGLSAVCDVGISAPGHRSVIGEITAATAGNNFVLTVQREMSSEEAQLLAVPPGGNLAPVAGQTYFEVVG